MLHFRAAAVGALEQLVPVVVLVPVMLVEGLHRLEFPAALGAFILVGRHGSILPFSGLAALPGDASRGDWHGPTRPVALEQPGHLDSPSYRYAGAPRKASGDPVASVAPGFLLEGGGE